MTSVGGSVIGDSSLVTGTSGLVSKDFVQTTSACSVMARDTALTNARGKITGDAILSMGHQRHCFDTDHQQFGNRSHHFDY